MRVTFVKPIKFRYRNRALNIIGAEDGIRTHDPLLGKWVAPHTRRSLHVCF